MRGETRRKPGPRHRMPLVAHTPRIQKQRPSGRGHIRQLRRSDFLELRLAGRGEKAALREKPLRRRRWLGARPLHRTQLVVILVCEMRETAEIEVAAAMVFEGRQSRMFGEDRARSIIVEAREAEPLGDFGERPPIGFRFAGRRQERTLARNAPLRIGNRAVLFAPAQAGRSTGRAARTVSFDTTFSEMTQSSSLPSALATVSARGRLTAGLVPMIHKALILP